MQGMVVGVNGEDVAKHAVLELRKEPVQVRVHQMEELNVLDLQVKIVTNKIVRLFRLFCPQLVTIK